MFRYSRQVRKQRSLAVPGRHQGLYRSYTNKHTHSHTHSLTSRSFSLFGRKLTDEQASVWLEDNQRDRNRETILFPFLLKIKRSRFASRYCILVNLYIWTNGGSGSGGGIYFSFSSSAEHWRRQILSVKENVVWVSRCWLSLQSIVQTRMSKWAVSKGREGGRETLTDGRTDGS